MESVKSGWQELKTTSGPRCPKLFYNFTANDDGFTLQFTDLIGFWTAVSPVNDIVTYAQITKTSIDPSDSQPQLRVLLQKLSQSLEEGDNTLRQENEERNAILLQTVLKLPRPLQPLKWEFYLEPRGTEELAENVLRPCLLEASESKKRLESLHEVIKAKDHVISRLMDKIEGTTIDLSMIFPGITGARSRRGQTTIKDAQKHVPGLKPFSKDEWQKHFEIDSPYAGFEMVGLSKLVAGCEKCPKHKSHQHEQWLKKLPKATSSASQAAMEQMKLENASSDEDDTDSDSDQFETQRKKVKERKKGSEENDAIANPKSHRPLSRAKTSSPIRSSSPLLPPPAPLSISQTQDLKHSSPTTTTSELSDLDNTTTATRSRLGQIGATPRTPAKTRPLPSNPPTSSSPPGPRLPSPSPQIPSSPPPLSTSAQAELRRKSSSSIATLSSLNPATPPKRRLGRLASFKSTSASVSATPEHKRFQDVKGSDKESDSIGSTQGTPSRRLGRIGRTLSQLSRQQTHSSPMPERREAQDENENNDSIEKADDSDASTASTASSVSPVPLDLKANNGASGKDIASNAMEGSTIPKSELASSVPQLETQKEMSKEEKAAQRREQLKRKIGTSETSAGNTVGNTGLRKKRKF